MRIAAIAIIVLCMAAPVVAEEILYCTDTDVNGFVWDEKGDAKRQVFISTRFTVKVISKTERVISKEGSTEAYNCSTSLGQIFCNPTTGRTTTPIIFKGNNFIRAFLYGTPIDGDPNIFVAYGTCTKF